MGSSWSAHYESPIVIILRNIHFPAACFDEIDVAVQLSLTEKGAARLVVFNAHAVDPNAIPPNAIVYNFENVGIQIPTSSFPGRTIWDFSRRNVERWRADGRDATYVPVGYHASMTRFKPLPWRERDIDVVFFGYRNDRRSHLMQQLKALGLRTAMIENAYGPDRDRILARSRIALNMLFYENGVFPTLRSAHLASNRIVTISETANDVPAWVYPPPVRYDQIIDRVLTVVREGEEGNAREAQAAFESFAASPLRLPAVV